MTEIECAKLVSCCL